MVKTKWGDEKSKSGFFLRLILQNITRLTVEYPAYCFQGGEPDCTYLTGFDFGKIDIGHADLLGKLV